VAAWLCLAEPSRGYPHARLGHKEGPLEDERPKSREETPKEGYDTSGDRPGRAADPAYGDIRSAAQLPRDVP